MDTEGNRGQLATLDEQDIRSNIRRIDEIFGTRIFEPENSDNPLKQSAFIELIILLQDLLHKCDHYDRRVDFDDHIFKNNYVHDVTECIKALRDFYCHVNSFKGHLDDHGNRVSFMWATGPCSLAMVGDVDLNSEFSDDIAFFFGTNRLYFYRHILRAYSEAKERLLPMMLMPPPGY